MKTCEIRMGSTLFGDKIEIADSFWSRFVGLMMRENLEPGGGLLLRHCSTIHCCFMRFPIDVVYLSNDLRVVGVETVKPWRIGGFFAGARHVLELKAGDAAGIRCGDRLTIKEKKYDRE